MILHSIVLVFFVETDLNLFLRDIMFFFKFRVNNEKNEIKNFYKLKVDDVKVFLNYKL
jgi:hypothetical protein